MTTQTSNNTSPQAFEADPLGVGGHGGGCSCSGCTGVGPDGDRDVLVPDSINIDGTGGTVNGKPVWTTDEVASHLNRTNLSWMPGTNNATPESGSVDEIRFGFFETQQQLQDNGYVYFLNGSGFGLSEYFNFATFSPAQREAARESMQAWDDLIAPKLVETSADNADINFGNLASAPTTQAYARLPTSLLSGNQTVNDQVKGIAGDIWISASQPSNLQLDEGRYGIHTQVHEIGHALGLSHPGGYNAAPGLSITYAANAEYAQDTRAYSVMSYFEASSLGARHFDFNLSTTAYAATPLIHDILAIQRIYGADMTTRTGDTVYGFNSNAGRDSYDFLKTPAPVMAIWDAGGNDTLDASGYDTQQRIDLTPGSLSSIGGVTINSVPTFEKINANRAEVGLAPIARATYDANVAVLAANAIVGRLTDNVGIAYGVTIENAVGGSGSDTIIGNMASNVLTGNAGDDLLQGRDGNDTLDGGIGADTLDGGSGVDSMTGGLGNDVYVVDNIGDRVIELINGGIDEIRTTLDSFNLDAAIENLTGLSATGQRLTGNSGDNIVAGGAGDDRVDGGAGDDTVSGGLGNDAVNGGSGDDLAYGGSGDDTVDGGSGDDIAYGGAGDDIIDGRSGADLLDGGDGADEIEGGSGDDTIIGGAGDDVLRSGSGADIFVFRPGFGNDRIIDFSAGDQLNWTAMVTAGFSVTTKAVGRDTLISFSDGSSILLEKTSDRDLQGNWFEDDAPIQLATATQFDWMMVG
jgi:serralysin